MISRLIYGDEKEVWLVKRVGYWVDTDLTDILSGCRVTEFRRTKSLERKELISLLVMINM